MKRLTAYAKIEIIEVADEKALEIISEAEMLEVKRKEGERILSHISADTYVNTLQLAAKMDGLATYVKSKILLSVDRMGLVKWCKSAATWCCLF